MIQFLLEFNSLLQHGKANWQFREKPYEIKTYELNRNWDLYLWGDPILSECLIYPESINTINSAIERLLKIVKGHYYFILVEKRNNGYAIGNSHFSILPIYYCNYGLSLVLSNSPIKIALHKKSSNLNKRFFLENILFYYPLFNQSCIKSTQLLPVNSFIYYSKGKCSINKHTCIEKYYTGQPANWHKSLNNIADLFIEQSAIYFPDAMSILSLTGGFDSRTLVACGLFKKKVFDVYCFGAERALDLQIAIELSAQKHIHCNRIDLNNGYIRKSSLSSGIEFIMCSAGTASFARAHYLYSAQKLAQRARYILSGNFGSEILRAAHNLGPVISPNLYNLFVSRNFDDAIAKLKASSEANWLINSEFRDEWEELIEDLHFIPRFHPDLKDLSLNQKFYITVFEEIFRKYFGAEISCQFRYVANRTPYLDFEFVAAIMQTELFGAYSKFFEHNPIRRFIGQTLYATIINKTMPSLGEVITDKGYHPQDLLGFSGKVRLAKGYFSRKVYGRFNQSMDPYSVKAAFTENINGYRKIKLDKELFNLAAFNKSFPIPAFSNSFSIALSQAYFMNQIKETIS